MIPVACFIRGIQCRGSVGATRIVPGSSTSRFTSKWETTRALPIARPGEAPKPIKIGSVGRGEGRGGESGRGGEGEGRRGREREREGGDRRGIAWVRSSRG
jgi:hypothetical protein